MAVVFKDGDNAIVAFLPIVALNEEKSRFAKKVGSPKKNCACRKAISREPLAFSDGLRLTWRLMGLSDRSDGDANAKRSLFSRLLCHFPAIAGWEKRDWCYALLDGGARPSLPPYGSV